MESIDSFSRPSDRERIETFFPTDAQIAEAARHAAAREYLRECRRRDRRSARRRKSLPAGS